jgi:hypothetical protein
MDATRGKSHNIDAGSVPICIGVVKLANKISP